MRNSRDCSSRVTAQAALLTLGLFMNGCTMPATVEEPLDDDAETAGVVAMVRVREFFKEKEEAEFSALPKVEQRSDRYFLKGTVTATYQEETKRRHTYTAEATRDEKRVPAWKVHRVTIDGKVVLEDE